MKTSNLYTVLLIAIIGFSVSCKQESNTSHKDLHDAVDKQNDPTEDHTDNIILTKEQASVLGIKKGALLQRNMSNYISVNGRLEVPPQNEAVITTSLGANIVSIKIIEGEEVKKGQVLAYIAHPDIIKLQTEYLQTYTRLTYLKEEFQRQQDLYTANIGSGKDYQKAKSEYDSFKGLSKGYESQLALLGLNYKTIREGSIASIAPIRSTINGFVEFVGVKTGQYVQPQTALFEIVNIEHIHADLMVFEKDIKDIRNGQTVKLTIRSLGEQEITGTIFSMGKSIEDKPRALHVHVEIDRHYKDLIVGMYVNARIIVDENLEQALPEEAFIEDGEKLYIFKVVDHIDLEFEPVEVIEKSSSDGYISFLFKNQENIEAEFALGGAYYLMAEIKKSEAGHSH